MHRNTRLAQRCRRTVWRSKPNQEHGHTLNGEEPTTTIVNGEFIVMSGAGSVINTKHLWQFNHVGQCMENNQIRMISTTSSAEGVCTVTTLLNNGDMYVIYSNNFGNFIKSKWKKTFTST